MITSIFLRHIKIYKGINFIPLSEGNGFSSIIGNNGVGKSSVLEALDFAFNKINSQGWPINNEAKYEGISGENFPYIAPVFLIKKSSLKKTKKDDLIYYSKAEKLSNFLWNTKYKVKGKFFDEFYKHRAELLNNYNPDEYFLIIIGKKYNTSGVFFGTYHKNLSFINDTPHKEYEDSELQTYFKGFYEYIISHYSYLYIPVETDVHTYTKLETLEMQKLMDKNIQSEIEKAIKPATLKQINKDLDSFVKNVESILEIYEYKGHFKNSLTMPDLVSKIIEAYFSIKVLNKKATAGSKRIPVSELSSGEKRKALIDVAYSFLLNNKDRDSNIILAIDEPEASLHMSKCYNQFEKLIDLSKLNHQILISTHWYGYLPIVINGSATSIIKNERNETSITFFNLYNYRETIAQKRKKVRGILPIDYNIKSSNDLVQSILFSIIQDEPYNWIVCEGLSEKIYFEEMFKDEIQNNNLRLLPLGGYREVRKLYLNLSSPIKDPDYPIKGKVFCIIDTDTERVEVKYEKNKNLIFERLLNSKKKGSLLVDVNNVSMNPPTEIEDCLHPNIYYQTLIEFVNEDEKLEKLLSENVFNEKALNSSSAFDLRDSEKEIIKNFFDNNEGFNKIRFARKYVELLKTPFYKDLDSLNWIENIKTRLK
ncbi:AAA family ATPase [Tenacibaculum piscium]|uniref:AAA family ATPase n=1 Tax=Tenacibaculum piscium TaxID=1458515 RepID=UPI001E4D3E40|nr:AAA family ATPase [Tenacibaculum piscium]MCD8416074.1 ATP-binding protein [Tenacibaculum dicentrarchi]MCD8421183.1 ATP-binding protein [Tenacibaculum dicentrarchi]